MDKEQDPKDTKMTEISKSNKIEVNVDFCGQGWKAVSYESSDKSQTFHGILMLSSQRPDGPSLLNGKQVDLWKQTLQRERAIIPDETDSSNSNSPKSDTNVAPLLTENQLSSANDRSGISLGRSPRICGRPLRLRPASSRLLCSKCQSSMGTVAEQASKRKSEMNNMVEFKTSTPNGNGQAPKRAKMEKPPFLSPIPRIILPKLNFTNPLAGPLKIVSSEVTSVPKVILSGPPRLTPFPVKPKGTAIIRTTGLVTSSTLNNPLPVTTGLQSAQPQPVYIKKVIHTKPIQPVTSIPKLRICYKPDGRAIIIRTSDNSNTMPKSGLIRTTIAPSFRKQSPVRVQLSSKRPILPKLQPAPPPPKTEPDKSPSPAPEPLTTEQNPLGLGPGDVVWAKMKGEPYWPAQIYSFNPGAEACILWLGSNLHGFLPINTLERFRDFFDRRYNSKRNSKGYQQAVVSAIVKNQSNGVKDEYYAKKLATNAWKILTGKTRPTKKVIKKKRTKKNESKLSPKEELQVGEPLPVEPAPETPADDTGLPAIECSTDSDDGVDEADNRTVSDDGPSDFDSVINSLKEISQLSEVLSDKSKSVAATC